MTAVPVELHVTRYRCPFCTRSRAKKATTEKHIARCWHNPEARGCKTCAHYEPADHNGPYPEHPGWPESCGAERDLTGGLVTGCQSYETAVPAAGEHDHA